MLGAWSFFHATETLLGARFTASLALALAKAGKRVLLFDLSPECPALDVFLAVDGRVVYTLSDVGSISPSDVILSPRENVFFVPCGVGETVDAHHISSCIAAFSPDAVLCSVGWSTLPVARELSDGMVLLTDASPVALRAATALADSIHFDGLLLTDFVKERKGIEEIPSLTEIMDALGLSLFGVLPWIGTYNTPVVKENDFLSAVENMAGRLMGENVPLLRGIPMKEAHKQYFFSRISE